MTIYVEGLLDAVVDMPRPVDEDVALDIEKESVFVSPHIDRIQVIEDGARAKVIFRDNCDLDETMDKVRRFLDASAKQVSGYEINVLLKNTRVDSGPYERNVNEALIERGWLHDFGNGQVAYDGPVLELTRLISEKAGALYRREFDAKDAHFPALIDAETLHKCGYLDSHPNAVTFAGTMVEDFDAIEKFRAASSRSESVHLPPYEHVHMGGMCLTPAACFPAYPTLQGRRVDTGDCFSWTGRVFRNESRNVFGLERLNDFNVCELLFVGSEDYVRDVGERSLPLVGELAALFDIDCKVQTAADPLHTTGSAADKSWQAALEVKSEIKIPVLDRYGNTKTIACGSVNLHGTFFGERFDIRDADENPVLTGCVELGVERLVLALFTQHGFDPKRWPKAVSETIF